MHGSGGWAAGWRLIGRGAGSPLLFATSVKAAAGHYAVSAAASGEINRSKNAWRIQVGVGESRRMRHRDEMCANLGGGGGPLISPVAVQNGTRI